MNGKPVCITDSYNRAGIIIAYLYGYDVEINDGKIKNYSIKSSKNREVNVMLNKKQLQLKIKVHKYSYEHQRSGKEQAKYNMKLIESMLKQENFDNLAEILAVHNYPQAFHILEYL